MLKDKLVAITLGISLSFLESVFGHGGSHPQPQASVGGGAPAQVTTQYKSPLSSSTDFFNQSPAQEQRNSDAANSRSQQREQQPVYIPKTPRDSMFGK